MVMVFGEQLSTKPMLKLIFGIILLFFLFWGEPDVFDLLREITINQLKDANNELQRKE